jgi:hypothetical protein
MTTYQPSSGITREEEQILAHLSTELADYIGDSLTRNFGFIIGDRAEIASRVFKGFAEFYLHRDRDFYSLLTRTSLKLIVKDIVASLSDWLVKHLVRYAIPDDDFLSKAARLTTEQGIKFIRSLIVDDIIDQFCDDLNARMGERIF